MIYINGSPMTALFDDEITTLPAEGVRGDPIGGDTVPLSYADEGGPIQAPLNW